MCGSGYLAGEKAECSRCVPYTECLYIYPSTSVHPEDTRAMRLEPSINLRHFRTSSDTAPNHETIIVNHCVVEFCRSRPRVRLRLVIVAFIYLGNIRPITGTRTADWYNKGRRGYFYRSWRCTVIQRHNAAGRYQIALVCWLASIEKTPEVSWSHSTPSQIPTMKSSVVPQASS